MLSATHKLIGKSIINNIIENFNIAVDQECFLNGCLKPDYSLPFFFIPHYKDKSFDYIIKMLEELIKHSFTSNKNIKKFYTKLGIITHFICDYFCYAHNNKKFDNMFLHLKYEKTLHIHFEELLNNKSYISPSRDSRPIEVYSLNNLINYINNMHKEYTSAPPSMEKDIYYALEVSNYTVNFIINYINNYHKYNVA
ncbi:zinc dependent phospholipase C family protein [Caloramator sp. ALD01]|uniref:zinc dependent phospholipase C family protein n=1 Tax=Caloramator sp. ALD01 TaxID=1031288 RepID=UPI00041AB17A|nr:zinc dependent phospholipase C family protein [Caloramator sp. ALD01]